MKYIKVGFEDKLPFTQHLAEIRDRLIRVLIFLAFLFVVCFYLSEVILEVFRRPIEGYKLIFINPTEAFFVHLKLAFFSALILCIPFILYHVWAFVAPGLNLKEQRYTLPFVLLSALFFILGLLFAYFLILPFALRFLLTYKASTLSPNITIAYYISFTFQILLVFGFIFELPPVVILLTKFGILKPTILTKNRRYAILVIFIVSAILTPPDVVTQILMAAPLILLYELSVLASSFIYKEKVDKKNG